MAWGMKTVSREEAVHSSQPGLSRKQWTIPPGASAGEGPVGQPIDRLQVATPSSRTGPLAQGRV